MKHRMLPSVTPLQFVYLRALSDGFLTGKQLRTKLERSGHGRNPVAFFRVIQRLKKNGLITARSIARDRGEYRGAQGLYTLTRAGNAVLANTRSFYGQAERRSRKRRWRRKYRARVREFKNLQARQRAASNCTTTTYSDSTDGGTRLKGRRFHA